MLFSVPVLGAVAAVVKIFPAALFPWLAKHLESCPDLRSIQLSKRENPFGVKAINFLFDRVRDWRRVQTSHSLHRAFHRVIGGKHYAVGTQHGQRHCERFRRGHPAGRNNEVLFEIFARALANLQWSNICAPSGINSLQHARYGFAQMPEDDSYLRQLVEQPATNKAQGMQTGFGAEAPHRGRQAWITQIRLDHICRRPPDADRWAPLEPNGMDPNTDMGPLISVKQQQRLPDLIQSGLAHGAELAAGSKRFGDRGFFVTPTVLGRTNSSMRVVKEEIFGPVVVAAPFDDAEGVIQATNDSRYELVVSIWTRDVNRARAIARKLQAGRAGINCHGRFDYSTPSGGFKEPGWGREHGEEGLKQHLESKSVFSVARALGRHPLAIVAYRS